MTDEGCLKYKVNLQKYLEVYYLISYYEFQMNKC